MMRTGRLLLVALALVGLSGCRNPFNPKADIRLLRFYAGPTGSYVLTISWSDAALLAAMSNHNDISVQALLANYSTVNATITSYSVVYRQLSNGSPIAACGGAAGRRFQCMIALDELTDNTPSQTRNPSSAGIEIITAELLAHIAADSNTKIGGIDCEVTFHGEDDNGYDIQVGGVLHIDVF